MAALRAGAAGLADGRVYLRNLRKVLLVEDLDGTISLQSVGGGVADSLLLVERHSGKLEPVAGVRVNVEVRLEAWVLASSVGVGTTKKRFAEQVSEGHQKK